MVEHMTLYLCGIDSESSRLEVGLREWCDRVLAGNYRLDVVDIGQWPAGAQRRVGVLAVPALTALSSGRMVVGDFSDIPAVMATLGLHKPAIAPGLA